MDLTDLKDILRILEKQEITEFELEQDGVKLRVCRSTPPPPSVAGGAAAPPAGPAPVAPPEPSAPAPESTPADATPAGAAEAAEDAGTAVPSPIVGTFYRAPDPNSPPFVSVGDQVQVGQVLCIIEAMKLMNEIESDADGVIAEVFPKNAQPVEFGEPLFAIQAD